MKINTLKLFALTGLAAAIAGCSSDEKKQTAATTADTALAADIKHHIAILANDSLLGRKPFTPGEDKTIAYISAQFKRLGLEPGNNGSYYQDVPMVEIGPAAEPTMQITGKTQLDGKMAVDFVAATRQELPAVDLKNSPLVFAGFGVVAPEYNWNDYKGLDVKGKTVVVLVNDPGFKAPERLFKGDTMTYYGRWTYKYEEAARQGAAGVLIVHQTEPASYGWQVIQNSFTGSKLYLTQADKHMNRCKVEGWLSEDAAKKLLAGAGINEDMRTYARKKDFKAVPLNSSVSISLKNKLKYSTSHNVIATLKGSIAPGEYILYTAHWDHFGKGKPDAKGDSIYNGAIDNASGVAAILAVAKKFTQAKDKPKRSIVFLAVTAEEQGLLGSEYYGTHPVYPLNKTVADLNIDALSAFGETSDFSITGKGQNDLDDYVIALTKPNGWGVKGDEKPGSGSYYRSDHFNFAKVGVPALDLHNGATSIDKGEAYGLAQAKDYNDNHYHQPSDEYSDSMNTLGMAQTAGLMYQIGLKLGNETTFPGWKTGSEFKAIRDKSMAH
ncbi:M28 family metallopeptidase [Mucilaginibacter psychrotolerans]|uniref:M20/M25/M40 family metallo-hydrolase n=1 Tax=Mucilaginibacter psychrotolerans TaxID=1524096 RepID=A0A4Y8S853_9SPHI|nr:M28 family metallopeptidase [Mucilaginibacter psychrotolerans]TFF35158.1 M20/M25/M40 family metallo-hydrolase [Mucilaginibacter psychrotolerans]